MRRWVLLGCAALACSFESSSTVNGSAGDTLGASSSGADDPAGSSTTNDSSVTTTGASAGSTTSTTASSDAPDSDPSSSSTAAGESDADTESGSESESASESDSDTTGVEAPQLTDDGLVVRYFLDEAPAGSNPTLALDAANDPLDLPLDYAEKTMHYVSDGMRRGLAFDEAGLDDAARGPIEGTKVAALEGTYQLTIEVVVRVEDAVSGGSRIVHIGHNNASAVTLAATDAETLQARWNDVIVREWDSSDLQGASHVLHLIVDTSAVNPASQFRLLADGVELNAITVANLPKDAPLEYDMNPILALGNRHQDRTFRGVLFYAAIYDHAISDTMVATHVEALQESDDTPDE